MTRKHSPQRMAPLQAHRRRFIVVLAILLLLVFLYMISDFLLGVIGGLLLWGMTRGVYNKFTKWFGGRRQISALLTLLGTLIFLITPVALILAWMAADAAELAQRAGKWLESYQPTIEAKLSEISASGTIEFFGYGIQVEDVVSKLETVAGSIGNFLLTLLQKTVGGIANAILLIFIMLYTQFFCYLDGPDFLNWLKRVLPLSIEQSERLLQNFFATSFTTLKTLGIIGIVQGGLGGLAFWVVGIPSPFFWTVVMALATVIPTVGAQIITVPAAVILILIGKTWHGVALLAWAWIVIANVDNILRPYLVMRAIHLHEIIVFLSTLGGIYVFGFFGFLIGPVIAALLKSVLEMYTDMFKLNVAPEASDSS